MGKLCLKSAKKAINQLTRKCRKFNGENHFFIGFPFRLGPRAVIACATGKCLIGQNKLNLALEFHIGLNTAGDILDWTGFIRMILFVLEKSEP